MPLTTLYMLLNIDRIGHIFMEPFFALGSGQSNPEDVLILYPEDRQPANEAAFAIVKRYFNFQPIAQFNQLAQAERTSGPDGNPLNKFSYNANFQRRFMEKYRAGQIKPRFYQLTDEEWEQGRRLEETLGIEPDAKIVTLHNREPGYLPHMAYHSYRDADISDYQPAVDFLMESGYWVVRLGDTTMTPMPKAPRLIDLPFTGHGHGLADIYFSLRCQFMLASTSGPVVIPMLFNGPPRLLTNWLPAGHICVSFNEMDRWAPKLVRIKRDNGRLMSLMESYHPANSFFHTQEYEKAGLEVVNNSPEDILMMTREMVRDLEANQPPDRADPVQQAYWRIAGMWQKINSIHGDYNRSYLLGPNMSTAFMEKYPDLTAMP